MNLEERRNTLEEACFYELELEEEINEMYYLECVKDDIDTYYEEIEAIYGDGDIDVREVYWKDGWRYDSKY